MSGLRFLQAAAMSKQSAVHIRVHKQQNGAGQKEGDPLHYIAGRIDPVEYVGVSQQRNGNVRNRNHPLCGCATLVIQKTPFHYNRGVQATI